MNIELNYDKSSNLQNSVLNIILHESKKCSIFLKLLFEQGCKGGVVGKLAWFNQTTAFYDSHKCEINEVLRESLGEDLTVSEFFGSEWNNSDPLVLGPENKNLLAWFSFMQIAENIVVRA